MRQLKRYVALGIVIGFVVGLVPALWAEDVHRININKASVEELTQLQQIGARYAQRIVEYRDEHGPFEKPEDIMKVPGVGARTFEVNKERICVE